MMGVALVTGGTRGIGRAIAAALVAEGMRVAVVARSRELVEKTAGELGCLGLAGDVSHPDTARELYRQVEQALGPVDLLVNNAGLGGPVGPLWENDPEDWWRCMEVNLRGPMLLCREVLKSMLPRRQGRIINVASGAGAAAIPNLMAYVVSKTALLRFTEGLAMEAGLHGVRVFALHPGTVRTEMTERILLEGKESLAWFGPYMQQEEVLPEAAARMVVRLARGEGDACVGQLISFNEELTGRPPGTYVLRLQG
ncbi:MAG: hypothetical protein AMXMBFR33_63080 [Candidatus Xenobia bacterium]